MCDSGVNNEKVVFCHQNGAGVGLKAKDSYGNDIGFYGCHAFLKTADIDIPKGYLMYFRACISLVNKNFKIELITPMLAIS